jgi:hypothetical protein
VNDALRLAPAVVILPVLAALALVGFFGFFHWNRGAAKQSSTPAQVAAPVVQPSATSEIAQPVVESSTPAQPGVRDPVKLAVTPAETKAALGENSVELVVKMVGKQAFSGGVVTLIYNPSIIEVMGVYPVKPPAPFTVTPRIENAQGWASVTLASSGSGRQQQAGNGIFKVQFVPIDTGRSEVALMAGSFTDAKGSSVPVEVSNGAVEVFVRE